MGRTRSRLRRLPYVGVEALGYDSPLDMPRFAEPVLSLASYDLPSAGGAWRAPVVPLARHVPVSAHLLDQPVFLMGETVAEISSLVVRLARESLVRPVSLSPWRSSRSAYLRDRSFSLGRPAAMEGSDGFRGRRGRGTARRLEKLVSELPRLLARIEVDADYFRSLREEVLSEGRVSEARRLEERLETGWSTLLLAVGFLLGSPRHVAAVRADRGLLLRGVGLAETRRALAAFDTLRPREARVVSAASSLLRDVSSVFDVGYALSRVLAVMARIKGVSPADFGAWEIPRFWTPAMADLMAERRREEERIVAEDLRRAAFGRARLSLRLAALGSRIERGLSLGAPVGDAVRGMIGPFVREPRAMAALLRAARLDAKHSYEASRGAGAFERAPGVEKHRLIFRSFERFVLQVSNEAGVVDYQRFMPVELRTVHAAGPTGPDGESRTIAIDLAHGERTAIRTPWQSAREERGIEQVVVDVRRRIRLVTEDRAG